MTIATQSSKVNYQGNGVTTEFQVPFPFLEGEDIYIQKQLDDTTVVNLTYGTDYSVTGAGNASGGTVVLTTAPSASEVISVYRRVPLTQEVNYRENEIFPAESHERALDKLTMEVQQLQEQSDRAIKVDVFSDVGPDVLIGQVERVWDSVDNIDIVANDKANMDTVALNIADVNTTATNIADVNTVAGISTQVVTVAGIASDVSAVAGDINRVDLVADNISSVNTVAANDTNITAVATNISDVNTAATNIEAIKDAPNQAISAQNSATQSAQSAASAAQSAQTATNKADEASESARVAVAALSLQIGDVMFAPLGIDESLNLRRYLNGQVLIQSQFVAFTNKVKSAIALFPNLATTEANWQAEKTNSKLGQCGKFVVDDTAGTIRLPAVVNAQGLVDLALIGTIVSESLPNITGSFSMPKGEGNANGAFYKIQTGEINADNVNQNGWLVGFDASRSSSTYQDNAPVQQEAVQYPYCIVVNVGVEESDRPINNYQVNNVYSYGMSQYYKGTMNNNSWLKSAGQWNSGTVYTGMYNWLLEQMNAGVSGFVASTAAYTDYDFVINTTDQTFRLPLLSNRVLVEKKEPTDSDSTWYNLYSDGWLEQGGVLETSQATTVTFVKPYITTPNVMVTAKSLSTISVAAVVMTTDVTLASFSVTSGGWDNKGIFTSAGGSVPKVWSAQGYTNIPQNTTWNLYYYIGDTLQNAQLINVARIEETLVDKADTDLSNCTKPYVTETYENGMFWYRVWSDGWIEQGARENIDSSFSQIINFIKPYENIPQIEVTLNGNITNGEATINSGVAQLAGSATNVNGNGFTLIKTSNAYANGFYAWKAQGR